MGYILSKQLSFYGGSEIIGFSKGNFKVEEID